MSEMTIFKDGSAGGLQSSGNKPLSKLGQTLASNTSVRRIQAHNSGTFRRIVAGQMIGKPLRGELNIIIINALPNVSRTYYANEYDPDAAPTLPDCWANNGERPEPSAGNKQSERCADCPQNIAGSGAHGGRACRYHRRLAVIVPGDAQNHIYQFNVPAKSLFGKGSGNSHPFESYVRFLAAHGESPDTVVTSVVFNDEAETMELLFSPVRPITEDEAQVIQAAQASPECESYVRLTVAAADGVTTPPPGAVEDTPPPAKPAAKPAAEETATGSEDDTDIPPPTKRTSKKKTAAKKAAEKAAEPLDTEASGESGMDDLISAWANAE